MSIYVTGLRMAMHVFPVIAFLIAIPILIFSYRKYGGLIFWRSLLIYSFVFYMIAAFFLTIFPLPDISSISPQGAGTQLKLFDFVFDFMEKTKLNIKDFKTYIPALKQGVFLQPIFNIFLTLPFGFYLTYAFKQSFPKVVIFSFLLSLFYEITQITGIYGIYPTSYRIFDVDDLLLNTLGGMFGYLFAKVIAKYLPTEEQMRKLDAKKNSIVTFLRRLVAWCFDQIILIILIIIIVILLAITKINIPFLENFFIIHFLYFSLFILKKGQTPGKKLVKIKITNKDGKTADTKQIFIRYGLLYILYPIIIKFLFSLSTNLIQSLIAWEQITGLLLFCTFCIMPIISFIYHLFKNDKLFLYEKLSKTSNISDLIIEDKSK